MSYFDMEFEGIYKIKMSEPLFNFSAFSELDIFIKKYDKNDFIPNKSYRDWLIKKGTELNLPPRTIVNIGIIEFEDKDVIKKTTYLNKLKKIFFNIPLFLKKERKI